MSQQIDHEEPDAEAPEQNGVAERLNRTLMDKARSMVAHAGLSKGFWAEAVNTANYLRNRSPCQTLKGHITPFEEWHGKKPDIAQLRTFGCIAYARVPDRVPDVTFDETRFRFALPAPSEETVDHVSDLCDRPEATKPVGARPEALPETPTEVVVRPERHCLAIKRWGIDEVYQSEINFVHSAFSDLTVPEPTSLREPFSSL